MPTAASSIESEREQAHDFNLRARAFRELVGSKAPNVCDRLASVCRRKVELLEELEAYRLHLETLNEHARTGFEDLSPGKI